MRGIVDPWRVVEPLHAPGSEAANSAAPRRVNLDQIDFDRDLRVPQSCTFRSRAGSIRVHGRSIASGSDGLRELVSCLFQILDAKTGTDWFESADLGFSLSARQWRLPPSDCPAAALRTADGYEPQTALYFRRQTYDDGMLRLIKLLQHVNRRPGDEGQQILKRWGVVPLSR
jgi:hypothetical protein